MTIGELRRAIADLPADTEFLFGGTNTAVLWAQDGYAGVDDKDFYNGGYCDEFEQDSILWADECSTDDAERRESKADDGRGIGSSLKASLRDRGGRH